MMRCGFCGYEFDPQQADTACPSCPLSGGCQLFCCPRCGYQIPGESKLITWLKRLRRRLETTLTTKETWHGSD